MKNNLFFKDRLFQDGKDSELYGLTLSIGIFCAIYILKTFLALKYTDSHTTHNTHR